MAPTPTYDSPGVQLRRLAARARRLDVPFDEFWTQAVREGRSLVMTNHPNPPKGAVLWPTDRNDRKAWQFGIHTAKEGWRRAYEGIEALSCERAMSILGDAIGALDNVASQRAEGELVDAIGAQAALPSAA